MAGEETVAKVEAVAGPTPAQQVAAHSQAQSHKYVMHFPPHPARTGDPHYADFNAYHRKHRDTATCYVGDRIGKDHCSDGPLELHHAVIEFSLQQGVDLKALEKDYPGISDAEAVGAWIESEQNFRWLCVLPGTPILMADGGEKPIEAVSVGDRVIGHDGLSHRVTHTKAQRYRGEVTRLTPTLTVTPGHRILTSAGWLPAGQIAHKVGMFGGQVVALRGIEDEVLRPVVGAVAVDVVNPLRSGQWTTDAITDDQAVLHRPPLVHHDSDVPLGRDVSAGESHLRRSGQRLQSQQSAGVRAVGTWATAPVGTGSEGVSTSFADEHRALRWLTGYEPVRALYTGFVHDLSVAHSHSFIAAGIAVHNCAYHHRGQAGAHTAAHADWTAGQYVPTLFGAPNPDKPLQENP